MGRGAKKQRRRKNTRDLDFYIEEIDETASTSGGARVDAYAEAPAASASSSSSSLPLPRLKNRAELKELFAETQAYTADSCPYLNEESNIVLLRVSEDKRLEYRNPQQEKHWRHHQQNELLTFVTSNDCLVDCKTIMEANPDARILLVSSGSKKRIGGGVVNGSTAQEEHLCRCTNLYAALAAFEKTHVSYPLYGKDVEGILTKQISVFRDPVSFEIMQHSQQFCIDILTVFCLHVDLIKSDVEDARMFAEIFEAIAWACQTKGPYTHLVLVPVGCGVFKHKPQKVARLMRSNLFDTYPLHLDNVYISCHSNQRNRDAFSYEFET